MSAEHTPKTPGTESTPADNAAGIPIPSRFGEPLARMLPIPVMRGRAAEASSAAAPAAVPTAATAPATAPGEKDEATGADTFYDQIGGHATFAKLVHVFYQGIAGDELLRPLYEDEDLGPSERRMLMFLEQYWGGPRTYLEERGHPRLRMRHMPFAVTPEARDRWLLHMRAGVDAIHLSPLHEATLWDYLERAAHSLVNSASSAPTP
ncbi:globin [Arthrobacter sp. ERGS1:01]|uniref:globin n=2 Tax=Arthrobacter sp. ERGS1:01 TaxID=1704044 RepID=UPI0006B60953|nr:globin [Arthrobacter sp. ERGS1:01]ALE06174.1 globin [Arthrobacter sp. ERGS1:01]